MPPLGQLYLVAHVLVSQVGFDCKHVRMIRSTPVPKCNRSVSERYKTAPAGERTNSRRITRFRDLIQPDRHYVDVFVPPNAPFEVHAFLKIIERNAFSDCEPVTAHKNSV